MQVVVWIVIILLALLLIWLLRKWIRRLIFILILLVLAFFIYGIFNPSWASRLWYNIRTFPERVTSRISDKKEFLDYDSYKLDISSVGKKIESEIKSDDTDSVEKESNVSEEVEKSEEKMEEKVEERTVQSFSWLAPKFVEIQQPTITTTSKKDIEATWYSKTDLIWIIGSYVENNLSDETDILVTVEYTRDVSNPEKIILETQPKSNNESHSASKSRFSLKNLFGWLRHSKSEIITVASWEVESITETETPKYADEADWVKNENPIVIEGQPEEVVTQEVKTSSTSTSANKTYRWLTQSEVREAEEIFWILF